MLITMMHNLYTTNHSSPSTAKQSSLHNQSTAYHPTNPPLPTANFGIPLDQLCERDKSNIPSVVLSMLNYLLRHNGLETEGLFRVNGNLRVVESLRDLLQQAGTRCQFSPDVNPTLVKMADLFSVASLLKLFLRQLPGGLIPSNLVPLLIEAFNSSTSDSLHNTDAKYARLERILSDRYFPAANLSLLQYLCQFLHEVAHRSCQNKMSSEALGIVFGPTVVSHSALVHQSAFYEQTTINALMTLLIDQSDHFFRSTVFNNNGLVKSTDSSNGVDPSNPLLKLSVDRPLQSKRPNDIDLYLDLEAEVDDDDQDLLSSTSALPAPFHNPISTEAAHPPPPRSSTLDSSPVRHNQQPSNLFLLSSGLTSAIRYCIAEHVLTRVDHSATNFKPDEPSSAATLSSRSQVRTSCSTPSQSDRPVSSSNLDLRHDQLRPRTVVKQTETDRHHYRTPTSTTRSPSTSTLSPPTCLSSKPRSTADDITRSLSSLVLTTRTQSSASKPPAPSDSQETPTPTGVEETAALLHDQLEEKRRLGGRPESVDQMTFSQIEAEKLALQKALLFFENRHGRPVSRLDRRVMRPLYSRYRVVKRALALGGPSPSFNGGDHRPGSMTTAHPSHYLHKAIGNYGDSHLHDDVGSSAGLFTKPNGHRPSARRSCPGRDHDASPDSSSSTSTTLSQDDRAPITRLPSQQQRSRSAAPTANQNMPFDPSINGDDRRSLSPAATDSPLVRTVSNASLDTHKQPGKTAVVELVNCSRLELERTIGQVLDSKRRMQRTLKDFEHRFIQTYGRKPDRADRLCMRAEYTEYHQLRNRLAHLEQQLTSRPA